MQKRKFFTICAILIIIPLIGLSAQCAADTEDKKDVVEDEKGLDESPADNDDKDTAGSDDELDDADSGEEADEADSEGETGEANSEDGADEADTEGDDTYLETEAPTISLGVYDGPIYSGADEVCYYRIEASVTGIPDPIVSFSKDDSGGAWGAKKVQINLNDPSDTYTLIATATNSEGSATDSITLDWGCEAPEPGPDIPEEDDVSSGMTSEDIISIAPYLQLSGIIFENGTFFYNLSTMIGPYINVGDEATNNWQIKAYISFDIKELHGKTVQDAEISIVKLPDVGHPESFASTVDYKAFDFGDSLDPGDFAIGGTMLERIPISSTSYTISGDTLKSELQMVIDDTGRDHFQLKLGLNGKTNNDGKNDRIRIDLRDVSLHIRYSD